MAIKCIDNIRKIYEQYSHLAHEMISTSQSYLSLAINNKLSMNDYYMIERLKREMEEYFGDIKQEEKIYRYILTKIFRINTPDLIDVIDVLDKKFCDRYNYIEGVFNSFAVATSIKCNERFYLPVKKYNHLTDENINIYKQYLHGFNYECLGYFLYRQGIYTVNDFTKTINSAKIYDVNTDDNYGFVFGLNKNHRT